MTKSRADKIDKTFAVLLRAISDLTDRQQVLAETVAVLLREPRREQ